jgi:hypothetical protein
MLLSRNTASWIMHLFRSAMIIFTLYRFLLKTILLLYDFYPQDTFAASGFCPQGGVTDLRFALKATFADQMLSSTLQINIVLD